MTLVPMTRGIGISSGKSFSSFRFSVLRCWSCLIFWRLVCSSALSSAKNADEQLWKPFWYSEKPSVSMILQRIYFRTQSYRRGLPISLRILHHSARRSFLVLSWGKDSLRQMQKSLSPWNRGLKAEIFRSVCTCWYVTQCCLFYITTYMSMLE